MQNFHQHVSCPTRGLNTLDHCYSQFKNAYKPAHYRLLANRTMPPFFLTPEYKQRLAQEPPVKREVTRWSSHSEAMLQAPLDDVDWDMFWASSSDVSEFTDVAVSFVNTLTEASYRINNCKDLPNQETVGGQKNQSVMRLTNAQPHTTRLFCLGIWASTRNRVMLSDVQ